MADERDRWLDRAAADRLLRGEPAQPVGPAADPHARARAARLRAALDALAEPSPARGELPGEAAAVAAFRAAHATRGAHAAAAGRPPAAASREALLDLGRLTPVAAPRSRRHVRFGLAAALASVAVGGLAAAAGAGLLDQNRSDSAGPVPAMSVSADDDAAPDADGALPTLVPQPRPTTLRDGATVQPDPGGVTATPEADGRTEAGAAATAGTGTPFGGLAAGGTGKDPGSGTQDGAAAGKGDAGAAEGNRDTFADAGSKERDDDRAKRRAATLCEDYRAGHLDKDRREKLSNLARGLSRIPRYCEALLDGVTDAGGMPGDATGAPSRSGGSGTTGGSGGSGGPGGDGGGDGVFRAPTLTPALPGGSGLRDRR
ncbi:hypothetical protein [Streptomyces antarcticus]|uniref:hypothetical protein n=1 Tax=Streptomyces antarcticus TaxID=2996458 RepID=UPI0022711C42|nr:MULTISPECIES: hypothetical protein [unclassified Streptomyces]MCY0944036.1 hypothetical protein [Streptomyces sp. H34-AA3]MCZ4082264.1 hypothetical protein [Streptomyces sp. H34-S5]